ncbi:MAG: SRPBCC domain-containing protein, partial [Kofleriaceae bacterium]
MISDVPPGDQVRVTTYVKVAVGDAFAVFSEEIDRWWRRGPAYRIAGRSPGTLHLEPRLGGKIFEQHEHARYEVGTITAWEPPARLMFEWRSITFMPDETTTVELWFEASGEGTRVT